MADAMRKVDIAHSGQTVVEAMEQLKVEVKNARRDRETMPTKIAFLESKTFTREAST